MRVLVRAALRFVFRFVLRPALLVDVLAAADELLAADWPLLPRDLPAALSLSELGSVLDSLPGRGTRLIAAAVTGLDAETQAHLILRI